MKRVAAAGHVGGKVVGPKPGAGLMVKTPKLDNVPGFSLYTTDSSAIAQRPGFTFRGAGVASSQILEALGRLSPALPVATLVWESESRSHSVSWWLS